MLKPLCLSCMDDYKGLRCELKVFSSTKDASTSVSSVPALIREYVRRLKSDVLSLEHDLNTDIGDDKRPMSSQLVAAYSSIAILSCLVLVCTVLACQSHMRYRR